MIGVRHQKGATHLYELSGEWYCLTQKSLLVWCNGWLPSGSPERIPELVEIPKAWSGEGLPPVGTVCEYRLNNSYLWHKCEVRYVVQDGTQFVIYCPHLGYEQVATTYGDKLQFRPIKTQEQLAAEEREKAINEMMSLVEVKTFIETRHLYEMMYDAGYRLTKTEE